MTPSRARIKASEEQLADFCRRHHIRWLALFGSVLRDDFRPESDIDVLIEFEAGHRYTYFTLAQIEDELSGLLGRRADLHMPNTLHSYLRDKVLRQAEALYAAAGRSADDAPNAGGRPQGCRPPP
jgi:predicted nucleotidyltransferase